MMEVEEICPPISHLMEPPRGQVQCAVEGCGQTVANQSALSMHMAKRHGLPRSIDNESTPFAKGKKKKTTKHFYCPVPGCERRLGSRRPFTSMFLIKQHYARMHAEKKFHCTKCGFGFAFKKELERHEKTCGQIWHCSCGCPYTTMEALWTHAARKGHSLPEKLLKKNDSKAKNAKRKSQCIPHSQQPVKVIVILPNQVQVAQPVTIAATNQAQPLIHPSDHINQSGGVTKSQPAVIGHQTASSHNQSKTYSQGQQMSHTLSAPTDRNQLQCVKVPSVRHEINSSKSEQKEKFGTATGIRRYVQILPKPSKLPFIGSGSVPTRKLLQNSATSERCETAVQATTASVCEVGIQTAAPSYIKRRQRIARQKENKVVDTRDEGTQTAGRKRTSEKLVTQNVQTDCIPLSTQIASRRLENLVTQNVQTDTIPLDTHSASRRLEKLVTQNVQTDSHPLNMMLPMQTQTDLFAQRSSTAVQAQLSPPVLRGVSNAWMQVGTPLNYTTNVQTQTSRPQNCHTQTPFLQNPQPAALQNPQPAALQNPQPASLQNPQPAALQNPQPAALQNPQPAALQNPQPAALQNTQPAALQNTQPAALQNTQPAALQTRFGFPAQVPYTRQQFPIQQHPTTPTWLTVPTLTNPVTPMSNLVEGNISLPSLIQNVPQSSDNFLSGGTQTDAMFQEAGSLSSAQTQTLPLPSDIEAMIFEHTSTQTLETNSIGIDNSGADMSSVEFSSMETQTTDLDFDIEDFLLLNDSQTQTNLSFAYQDMEPLHSYTQTDPDFDLHDLLTSHPETDLPPQQSSTQTQTMQNTADNFLSNMETQTAANGFLFPELELTDMETQAGSSFVGGGFGNAQTQTTMDSEQVDTHTQTFLSEFEFLQ